MSTVPAWFERKFDFSFPVQLYPNLCARLRGTPARLEDILRNCPRELLIRKPEQKWSIQEHAGHLLDLEPLWRARVEDFTTQFSGKSAELTAADLTNRETHEAGHNARPLNLILSKFRAARSNLVARVEKLDPAMFADTMLHPRLKTPMRLVDHLYFVAEHDDHHLAHIWALMS